MSSGVMANAFIEKEIFINTREYCFCDVMGKNL